MPKTDKMSIKIEHKLKADAEEILSNLGLTLNAAVNIFLNQVVLQRGIPFTVKIQPLTINEARSAFLDK